MSDGAVTTVYVRDSVELIPFFAHRVKQGGDSSKYLSVTDVDLSVSGLVTFSIEDESESRDVRRVSLPTDSIGGIVYPPDLDRPSVLRNV